MAFLADDGNVTDHPSGAYLFKRRDVAYDAARQLSRQRGYYTATGARFDATVKWSVETVTRDPAVRDNPTLAVLAANPRPGAIVRRATSSVGRQALAREVQLSGEKFILSRRAYALSYEHVEDKQDYAHEFASGVVVTLMPDGSIRLHRPDGKSLWRDFA